MKKQACILNHHIHYASMKERIKELLVYGISGIACLFIFGYCVHIFVGGLVSEQTEIILIAAMVMTGAAVIAYFVWDTIRRSR